jgi:hypothetical protein
VAIGAALAVVLVTGCGGDGAKEPGPAAPTTTTAVPAPTVSVTASARGDGSAGALKQAATKATPELQTFLTRYVTTAFDPATARAGYQGFSRYFDPALRQAVTRDMASLSLGPGGAKLTQVSTRPAAARAVFLIAGGRPIAATVRLEVDGTASAGGGQTPISLRAAFQLERVTGGWRIAAYDSQATVPE